MDDDRRPQPMPPSRASPCTADTIRPVENTAAPTPRPLSGPVGRRVAAYRAEAREVLRSHGVTNAEIFGSAARGDDHEGSDVDVLVDLPAGTSIIDIIASSESSRTSSVRTSTSCPAAG